MITAFLTFVFFFAIVGCVLYGRKLIKTEKVDAVFGNPERAQGGIHWVIVGSSFLLLVWLYYSWDIAKSFFPRSANELCQVGKVNESLLSLKYLFPIEERQLKSTSVIETETENLNKIIIEIEKSEEVKSQDKNKLLNFVSQTKNTIPLLTNEKLLNNETKEQIKIIVFPVSFQILRTNDCIFSLVNASKAPSGSSIKIKSGSFIKHLAKATLCCMPPDNW